MANQTISAPLTCSHRTLWPREGFEPPLGRHHHHTCAYTHTPGCCTCDHTVSQSIRQTDSQSISQSCREAAHQSVSQSVSQSWRQVAHQSIRQTVIQSTRQTLKDSVQHLCEFSDNDWCFSIPSHLRAQQMKMNTQHKRCTQVTTARSTWNHRKLWPREGFEPSSRRRNI